MSKKVVIQSCKTLLQVNRIKEEAEETDDDLNSKYLRELLNHQKHKAFQALESQSSFFEKQIQTLGNGVFRRKREIIKNIKRLIEDYDQNQSNETAQMIINEGKELENLKTLLKKFNIKFFEHFRDDSSLCLVSEDSALEKLLSIKVAFPPPSQQKPLLNLKKTQEEKRVVWPKNDDDWGAEETSRNKFTRPISSSPSLDLFKIKKRLVFKTYTIDAQILNIFSFNDFYVRNLHPELKTDDENFLQSLQNHFKHTNWLENVKNPRKDFIAAFNKNGVWYRARIIYVNYRENSCKLLLFDVGRFEDAKYEDLFMMPKWCFEHHQISIRCRMANIAPIKKLREFPEEAINKLKQFAKDPGHSVQLVFVDDLPEGSEEAGSCIVYIRNDEKGVKINFNDLLVKKGYAESTGHASLKPITDLERKIMQKTAAIKKRALEKEQTKQQTEIAEKISQEPTKRVPVIIHKAVSPGEFYLIVKSREKSIENLLDEINETDIACTSPRGNWKKDDMCLAFISINGESSKWFRARIIKVIDENNSEVALIDYHLELNVSHQHLAVIPYKYASFPPRIIKAHLAKTKPPAKARSWPTSTLDEFMKSIQKYNSYSIAIIASCLEVADEKGSLPVILYGVVDQLTGPSYHNLIEYLYNEGLIDTEVNFYNPVPELLVRPCDLKPIEGAVAEFSKNAVYIQEDQQEIANMEKEEKIIYLECEKVMNITPKKIKSWITAEAPEVGKRFFGTPTHVDDNGIIFFQTRDQTDILNEITEKITNFYNNTNMTSALNEFKPGDCVITRYVHSLDLYRAVVVNKCKNEDGKYLIEYVDYGTRCEMPASQFIPMVIADNIPILAYRFVLTEVLPCSLDNKWSNKELNFFQSRLCDNLCSVAVVCSTPDKNVQGVKISVEQHLKQIKDIASQAVKEVSSRPCSNTSSMWPIKFWKDDTPKAIEDNVNSSSVTSVRSEKNTVQNFYTSVPVDVVRQHIKVTANKNAEWPREEIKKRETSPVTNEPLPIGKNPRFSNRARFAKKALVDQRGANFFDFESIDCKEFMGNFIGIYDYEPQIIYIEPQIPEIQKPFDELMEYFNNLSDKYLTKFKSLSNAVGRSCVVNVNGIWLRGEIQKIDEGNASVFFVDIAKEEIVATEDLRKSNMMTVKCPRKIIRAKLKIEASDPKQSREIFKSMIEKYHQKLVKVTIKGFDSIENYPIVELSM